MTTDTRPEPRRRPPGKYADVNGINLYYETHGSGRPLILLHGGLGVGRDVRAGHSGARRETTR